MTYSKKQRRQIFERTILPHLDAAYNLARWLMPSTSDAEDVVQEAYLKAFRSFDTYQDQNSRAWILTIIRNTSYNWLKKNNKYQSTLAYNDSADENEIESNDDTLSTSFLDPSEWLAIQSDIARLYRAIDQLPLSFKEILILREIEGCDYRELSEILDIAPGTVMSRLSRARAKLQQVLLVNATKEKQDDESNEL